MRIRLSSVAVSLFFLLVGLPEAQAQSQGISVQRTNLFSDTMVTLCHIPPGNPANAQTIEVPQAAMPAHLAHGDTLGACLEEYRAYPAPVPKTGQSRCWIFLGGDPYHSYEVDCAGTGQDGELQAGVSVDPRFNDNGDGTVRDNLTGLIWLRNPDCFGERPFHLALTDAGTLADDSCALTDQSLAGDWRLPNVYEMRSLLEVGSFGARSFTLPEDHPFPEPPGSFGTYWSSTTVGEIGISAAAGAWTVDLAYGGISPLDFFACGGLGCGLYHARVWPVRGGQ